MYELAKIDPKNIPFISLKIMENVNYFISEISEIEYYKKKPVRYTTHPTEYGVSIYVHDFLSVGAIRFSDHMTGDYRTTTEIQFIGDDVKSQIDVFLFRYKHPEEFKKQQEEIAKNKSKIYQEICEFEFKKVIINFSQEELDFFKVANDEEAHRELKKLIKQKDIKTNNFNMILQKITNKWKTPNE